MNTLDRIHYHVCPETPIISTVDVWGIEKSLAVLLDRSGGVEVIFNTEALAYRDSPEAKYLSWILGKVHSTEVRLRVENATPQVTLIPTCLACSEQCFPLKLLLV
jgi:hypothetical protein